MQVIESSAASAAEISTHRSPPLSSSLQLDAASKDKGKLCDADELLQDADTLFEAWMLELHPSELTGAKWQEMAPGDPAQASYDLESFFSAKY